MAHYNPVFDGFPVAENFCIYTQIFENLNADYLLLRYIFLNSKLWSFDTSNYNENNSNFRIDIAV